MNVKKKRKKRTVTACFRERLVIEKNKSIEEKIYSRKIGGYIFTLSKNQKHEVNKKRKTF